MIKNRTVIEVEVKGREYRLECFSESPLDEVKDAIILMHNYVVERINAIPKPDLPIEDHCVEVEAI
jgi:hypothetical protein